MMKYNKEEIEKVARKYRLKMVLIFGSQVNSKAKENSDIDIAYLAEKSLNSEQKLDLNNELSFIFSYNHIDQVDLEIASPLLLWEIAQNSQLIFGKEIDYVRFKTKAFRIFIDSDSLFKLQNTLIKKKNALLAEKIYA